MPPDYRRPPGLECAGYVAQDAGPHLGVTDDALAFRDDGAARLELRLHQDDEVARQAWPARAAPGPPSSRK